MKKTFFILTAVAMLGVHPLFAEVMNSNNYSIESDSVNFGGGYSSSVNYKNESTFGEVATGPSGSSSYNLKAGYQQMSQSYLAMSTQADVTLTPSIDGSLGGTANGQVAVTVTTDSPAGYELYIKASSSPAMSSGINSFGDYAPAGVNPDFTFNTPVASSRFGFTPEGSAVVARWKDDGSTCNTGALNTADACWDALGTVNKLVSKENTSNYPGGTPTTLKFRAQSDSANLQAVGTYTATTTVTAIAL